MIADLESFALHAAVEFHHVLHAPEAQHTGGIRRPSRGWSSRVRGAIVRRSGSPPARRLGRNAPARPRVLTVDQVRREAHTLFGRHAARMVDRLLDSKGYRKTPR